MGQSTQTYSTYRWEAEEAARCVYVYRCSCVSSGALAPGTRTGCQTARSALVIVLMASLCFPSRLGLMTALVMPDGSHQSSFNSRKTSKHCLQNGFVHSFSLFSPGSDPQAALWDLLRRSRVENCQNRLLVWIFRGLKLIKELFLAFISSYLPAIYMLM